MFPTWLRSSLLIAPIVWTVSLAPPTIAAPAKLFLPYLEQIRQALPPGWAMRLPSDILLGGPADDEFISQLTVKILATQSPPGFTIALYSCERSPMPCLVGSFAVDRADSPNAQRELKRHMAAAAPIKLGNTNGVRGYLLHGPLSTPRNEFSSVMWQQDNMIYTVTFLAAERQNLLYMAYSMANNQPYFSLQSSQK